MSNILVELTEQQLQNLSGFLDLAVKNPNGGGLRVCAQAHELVLILDAAYTKFKNPPIDNMADLNKYVENTKNLEKFKQDLAQNNQEEKDTLKE